MGAVEPATWNRHVATLCSFAAFCARRGWVEASLAAVGVTALLKSLLAKPLARFKKEPAVVAGALASAIVFVAGHFGIVLDAPTITSVLTPLVLAAVIRFNVSPAAAIPAPATLAHLTHDDRLAIAGTQRLIEAVRQNPAHGGTEG